MPFKPASWVPPLPFEIPDTVPISEFMFDERYGRYPLQKSRTPFICGISGKAPSAIEVKAQIEDLAKALSKELGWQPNEGTEYDKVAGMFSVNTIDYLTAGWAVHRLGGILTPANAQYSTSELEYQLRTTGATCLFTCLPLLESALTAAKNVGIPKEKVFLMELPAAFTGGLSSPGFKTVAELIAEGRKITSDLEPLKWIKGEGKRRCAFICFSSGTSGLPKGVMISHYNVIANTMQTCAFEELWRRSKKPGPGDEAYLENALGVLPMSHIYGLVVTSHVSCWRGDGVVVLPKFEFNMLMKAVQDYKANTLYLVPPIIILMTKNKDVMAKYDLSHVTGIFTGAAPLGKETADELNKIFPNWKVRQGYGLTETSTVVCSSPESDIWLGSSGVLIPDVQVRIMDPDGKEITEYDKPGELWVCAPSVVLGYLNNEKANRETFVIADDGKRYMRTGDEVLVRKSSKGNEHLFIVDRIKELIKVKGLQVAPAELEAHLLTHPSVADCAVIPVPDDAAGEVPKAFVVKSASVGLEESDQLLARDIAKHVEKSKSRHKWLKGGVEFIDVIPKSPSGKILRRLLRDRERERRKKAGAKL
ncbi:uncharacterized protein PV09_07895 [Verruconis gallopava]|uniref:Phenylacetyl-CoA ligase n=1 Tax=Verruconis gallopava TaxID=253628 RepID=A0A0D2A2H9_9PEZI|nr:uncharacterized protein PV09_07895 [Verruconis gallopava]KIW00540.1 hypothetical protein PV09_07895 [Verruconis gallopava]